MTGDFLRAECPWSSFKLGKVLTCEDRLCSWVRQPLNTYSSVVFLLAALYLFLLYRRERRLSDLVYGSCLVLIGIASALNHASQIRLFVSLDFSAIFVLVCALFVLALRRLGWLRNVLSSWALFVTLLVATAWLQFTYVRYGIPLVALLVALVLGTELVAQPGLKPDRGKFWVGLLVLAVGAYCFYLDAWAIQCDPSNHFFQLHSVWHLACALGLFLLAGHHRQFYPPRKHA